MPAVGGSPQPIAADGCPAGIERGQGDLATYLKTRPIAASGSGGFTAPTAAEFAAFIQGMNSLMAPSPNAQPLQGMAFKVTCHPQPAGAYLVVEDTRPGRGGGAFAVNSAATKNLFLEVPHAISDEGTLEQGTSLLVAMGAKALVITGTHRCASATASTCSGTSAVCGSGGLRISDAAHFSDNFFTAAHRALRTAFPSAVAVSLHGMDSPGAERAVISDGTSTNRSGSISIKLRNALNQRLAGNMGAFSCNDVNDSGKHRPLCGTTNVQGRIDNGSANGCGAAASSGSDRFLHIEQSAEMRGTATGANVAATVLRDALGEVVP